MNCFLIRVLANSFLKQYMQINLYCRQIACQTINFRPFKKLLLLFRLNVNGNSQNRNTNAIAKIIVADHIDCGR